MNMYRLETGKPYNPNRVQWPQTPMLRIMKEGTELLLAYRNPLPGEITAVLTAPIRFAWVPGDRVSFLCCKIGSSLWSDCPFQAHRGDPDATAGLARGQRLLVHVILIDAGTGIIAAMRQVTWNPYFTDAVRASLERQLSLPFDDAAAEADIARTYSSTPSAKLRRLAAAACTGGK